MGRNTKRYVRNHKPRCKSRGNPNEKSVSKKRKRVLY